MAQVSWRQPLSGHWSRASRWSNGRVPGPGADVTIGVSGSYDIALDQSRAVHSVTLDGPGATLSIGSGGTLNVGTTFALEAGTLDLAGVIAGGTILAEGGAFEADGGTLANLTYQGTLTIEAGETLSAIGLLAMTGSGGTGTGTIDLAPGTTIPIGNGTIAHLELAAGATLANAVVNLGANDVLLGDTGAVIAASTTLIATNGAAIENLTNDGSIDVVSQGQTAAILSGSFFNNAGLVSVADGGRLSFLGGLFPSQAMYTNSGTIEVGEHARLNVEMGSSNGIPDTFGTFTNSGLIEIGSGSTFYSVGPTINTGTIDIESGGTYTLDRGGLRSSGLVIDNGTMSNGDDVVTLARLAGSGTLNDVDQVKFTNSSAESTNVNIHVYGDDRLVTSTGQLSFLGGILNEGMIFDNHSILFQQNVTGDGGTIDIASGATATLMNGAVATQTVDFATGGATSQLALANPLDFLGTVAGFGANDQIDLLSTAADTKSFANGTLTVSEGTTTVASLNFSGSYHTANFALTGDGSGGTLITYQT